MLKRSSSNIHQSIPVKMSEHKRTVLEIGEDSKCFSIRNGSVELEVWFFSEIKFNKYIKMGKDRTVMYMRSAGGNCDAVLYNLFHMEIMSRYPRNRFIPGIIVRVEQRNVGHTAENTQNTWMSKFLVLLMDTASVSPSDPPSFCLHACLPLHYFCFAILPTSQQISQGRSGSNFPDEDSLPTYVISAKRTF